MMENVLDSQFESLRHTRQPNDFIACHKRTSSLDYHEGHQDEDNNGVMDGPCIYAENTELNSEIIFEDESYEDSTSTTLETLFSRVLTLEEQVQCLGTEKACLESQLRDQQGLVRQMQEAILLEKEEQRPEVDGPTQLNVLLPESRAADERNCLETSNGHGKTAALIADGLTVFAILLGAALLL